MTEPKVVTAASIHMSDSTHFRAIMGDRVVEKGGEKPPDLGAEEAAAPASMEVEVIGAAACTIASLEDEQYPAFQDHSKTESPSKRRG